MCKQDEVKNSFIVPHHHAGVQLFQEIRIQKKGTWELPEVDTAETLSGNLLAYGRWEMIAFVFVYFFPSALPLFNCLLTYKLSSALAVLPPFLLQGRGGCGCVGF